VRTYLLDTEQDSRAQPVDTSPRLPVDNFVHIDVERLDDRIVRISERTVRTVLGQTVVPMLNALIQASGEQRRDLIELRDDVERIKRTLREKELVGAMAAMDAMKPPEFEQHVARLCRRDGCTRVVVTGGHGDLGADIVGCTADGRRLVVQCKHYAPNRSVQSGDVQKFIGMAKVEYRADVALFVATCPFTREALNLAARHGVTAVHRGLLESWSTGTKLQALR
jgi:restriction system protein